MQKIKNFLINNLALLIIFILLVIPALSLAAGNPPTSGLVPCDNVKVSCDFNQLMALINEIIHFILFYLAIPIAAIMFAYAGFELVSSGGSKEKIGIAKKVFTSALLGLIFAAAAWIIVNTILSILGYSGDWIGFMKLSL